MNTYTGFAVGFIAGASTGIILGLLFAPKKGKYFRRDIQEKYDEVVERGEHVVRHLMEKATDTVDDITKKVGMMVGV